jgi:putative ABC transport system ATP-binding protein
MVTHDPAAAARANMVVFLADGRIIDRLDRPDAARVAARLASLEG